MPSSEVMHKFKEGKLHSGSKGGPEVHNRKQAIAIMLSEKRNEAAHGGHYMHKSRHGSGLVDLHGHNVVQTWGHWSEAGEPHHDHELQDPPPSAERSRVAADENEDLDKAKNWGDFNNRVLGVKK